MMAQVHPDGGGTLETASSKVFDKLKQTLAMRSRTAADKTTSAVESLRRLQDQQTSLLKDIMASVPRTVPGPSASHSTWLTRARSLQSRAPVPVVPAPVLTAKAVPNRAWGLVEDERLNGATSAGPLHLISDLYATSGSYPRATLEEAGPSGLISFDGAPKPPTGRSSLRVGGPSSSLPLPSDFVPGSLRRPNSMARSAMRAQARSSADYGPRRSPRVSTEGAPMGPGGSGDLPLRARGSTLSSEGQHGGRARISATGSQGALQGAGGWRLSTDGRGARVSVDGHPRGRSRLSTDGRGRASTDGRAPKQGWSLQEKGSVAEEIIPE